MSFIYEERSPQSSFIERIWHVKSSNDGVYSTPADGCWDLIIIKKNTRSKVFISGPTSKATTIHYKKGSEYFGIRFTLGVYLPHLPAKNMLDIVISLPKKSRQSFWLSGSVWKVPEYETVEELIEELLDKKVLAYDHVVHQAFIGAKTALSVRSLQRRFLLVTGMTLTYLQAIEKARKAIALLQQGLPILDVVYETGYADQSHMTRSLKHLTGYTPTAIKSAKKLLNLSFSFKPRCSAQ